MNQALQERLTKAKCPDHGEMFINDCETCFCALSLHRDAFAHAYVEASKQLAERDAEARRDYTVTFGEDRVPRVIRVPNATMDTDLDAGVLRLTSYPEQTEHMVRLGSIILIESARR